MSELSADAEGNDGDARPGNCSGRAGRFRRELRRNADIADQPFSVTDLRPGTGAIALNGSLVLVNYTGWLYNPRFADNKGGMFETSIGGSPFAFVIGDDEVIRGWDLGVAGMAVGGLRRLIIPPSLAYGDERNGIIPPYSTLIFEIELVAIADDAEGSGP